MAIAGEGYFLSGVILVPVVAWAVAPESFGWQVTARWIGVVFLAGAWPVSRLVRNRPEDYGLYPDGDPPPDFSVETGAGTKGGDAETALGFTARQAIRTRAFWLISFGHALSTMLIGTLTVHLVPMLTDEGFSLQTAAYVWSVIMAAGAVFQILGGYVGDRVPKNVAIFVFATIQAAGFTLAAFVHSLPMALLFAVVYGIGFGGRNPLTTAIRGDYFGRRAFATITGISMTPLYLFLVAAPLSAAAVYDISGSYRVPFLAIGALGSLSGVLFLFAKKPVLPEPVKSPAQVGRDVWVS